MGLSPVCPVRTGSDALCQDDLPGVWVGKEPMPMLEVVEQAYKPHQASRVRGERALLVADAYGCSAQGWIEDEFAERMESKLTSDDAGATVVRQENVLSLLSAL